MKGSSRLENGTVVVAPEGRVDETSWEAFLAQLEAAVGEAAGAGAPLVIDFERLDYMSSRGLRALTVARKEADAKGVDMTLARPNARMREILAISRYDKIFTVVDALDGAR